MQSEGLLHFRHKYPPSRTQERNLNAHLTGGYGIISIKSEEIAQMKEAAQQEIQREQARAVEKLKGDMVTLSLAAAQKIVSKNIDVAENEALISEFIDQLDKNKIGDLPC